jgi:hypothetical protein
MQKLTEKLIQPESKFEDAMLSKLVTRFEAGEIILAHKCIFFFSQKWSVWILTEIWVHYIHKYFKPRRLPRLLRQRWMTCSLS